VRIIIVDDSAVIRAILEQNLKKINKDEFDIIGSVSTGRKGIDCCESLNPDVVICDVDMPEMNGIEATRIITTKFKVPVLVFSDDSEHRLKAKGAGASDFIIKPALNSYNSDFFNELISILRRIAKNQDDSDSKQNSSKKEKVTFADFDEIPDKKGSKKHGKFKILCIGASTGGPTAVATVLSKLGNNFPIPIIYSQHIEIGADKKMSQWLDDSCMNIHIKLAEDGEEAIPGCVYMAPADRHLLIDFVKPNGNPVLKISDDPPERFLRPAVNKMFVSAANFYKTSCLAVLLTGMGRDGADGCKKIVDVGGYTIAEDESTCAVFGMPAAAIEVGGAKEVLPRNSIPSRILELVTI